MDTFVAFTTCLGGCGARQVEEDATPPRWLQQRSRSSSSASESDKSSISRTVREKPYMPFYPYTDNSTGNGTNDDDLPATADRVVRVLLTAATREDVDAQLADIRAKAMNPSNPSAASWKDSLATAILERLVEAVRKMDNTAPAAAATASPDDDDDNDDTSMIATIVAWARETAADIFQWAHDHPQLATFLAFTAAVAVLWVLLPWVLEAVGFGELGPIAGSIAARLQMRYLGLVPKGSWFSFFQRLGMIWKH